MTVKLEIVPSPLSGTGSHARSAHDGQNSFGGIARGPPRWPRTPISWPARAFSKKARCEIAGSVTAEQGDQDGGGVAAERVGETHPGAVHLARTGVLPELGDDLRDLRRARGSDRMSLGLETARRIDRHLAADARPSLLGGDASRARLEEAEPLRGDDLGDGEAVVQLHHVDILRSETRLTGGDGRRPLGGRY